MNTKFCESCFALTVCWPSTWVSLASGVSSAPEGWSTSTTVFISPGRRVRVKTLLSGQDTSSTITSSLPENRRDSKNKQTKSTQRHSERRSRVFHFWRRRLPRPKCATGSISHRYPEPPSMMRVWTPLRLVKAVTVAPRAKEPNWVRGTTRSQLLDEPWWEFTLYFSPQTFATNMASVLRALFRHLVPTWLHFEKQLWLANQSGELWLERECSMCPSTRP